MNTSPDPRQRVLIRLKDAGAAAALIDHAEKMGYGKDSAMWEFADMLGLVAERMQRIPTAIEKASQFKLIDTRQIALQKTVSTRIVWPAAIIASALTGMVSLFIGGTDMPVLQIGLAMLLGISVGGAGTLIALAMKETSPDTPAVTDTPAVSRRQTVEVWTEGELRQVADGLKISNRTMEACWDVLINGDSEERVIKHYGLYPSQLRSGLRQLREARKKVNR